MYTHAYILEANRENFIYKNSKKIVRQYFTH